MGHTQFPNKHISSNALKKIANRITRTQTCMPLKFQQENMTRYTRKKKASYEIKARRFTETINGKDSGFDNINGTFFERANRNYSSRTRLQKKLPMTTDL